MSRGAGAAIGLPLLDAMIAPFARAATAAPRRMIVVYAPSGKIMPYWTPERTGAAFELPRTLKPLEKHRDSLLGLSGLAANNGNALGDGAGEHARAASSYLTGVHPRKTEGADIRCGRSMDQYAAAHLAGQTRLPSLEITCEDSRQIGSCDSYSCVYQSISWKSETQPMPPEMNPRQAFERLFGDASLTPEQRASRRSVLDYARGETSKLARELGPQDRRKLDEYLTAIREIETRIERADHGSLPAGASAPAGIPTSYREHARLMFRPLHAGPRVRHDAGDHVHARARGRAANLSGGGRGKRTTPAHHRDMPELVEKVAKVNEFHVQQFAYFLDRMAAAEDGDGRLLDHTAAVYGAAIGDPNVHDHNNLPTLVAGAKGLVRGGRHVLHPKDTPIANLHLALLDYVGAPVDQLGDSTGRLNLLADLG